MSRNHQLLGAVFTRPSTPSKAVDYSYDPAGNQRADRDRRQPRLQGTDDVQKHFFSQQERNGSIASNENAMRDLQEVIDSRAEKIFKDVNLDIGGILEATLSPTGVTSQPLTVLGRARSE